MKFNAIISKIQTTIDGGLRIQLDLDDQQVEKAKELLSMREKVLEIDLK
jgi:hypothetical protein